MQQFIRTRVLVLLLAIAAVAAPALAKDSAEEGIVLAEGQWIFDVRIQMPMQAKPTLQKLQTCATSDPITAETLMPWAEKQGCKIRSVKVVENGLTWQLRCNVNGQRSRGKGEFTVEGDQGKGKSRVNFEMGGRRVSIITKWDANRVGPCTAGAASDVIDAVDPGEDE